MASLNRTCTENAVSPSWLDGTDSSVAVRGSPEFACAFHLSSRKTNREWLNAGLDPPVAETIDAPPVARNELRVTVIALASASLACIV